MHGAYLDLSQPLVTASIHLPSDVGGGRQHNAGSKPFGAKARPGRGTCLAEPICAKGHSRSGIEAGGDRLRPVCQPWGGPRALNGRWSNEFGSLAAADHCNTSVNKRGARMSARIGRISVPARLIFAQMAQKSPANPAGFFCGDDGGTPAEASPVSAAAHAAEPPLNSWHASA